jgi:hypothetical protein
MPSQRPLTTIIKLGTVSLMTNNQTKATEMLRERIRGLSDDDLLRMLYCDYVQYREETLDYARAEVNKRRLSLVPLSTRKLDQVVYTRVGISWQAICLIASVIFWFFSLILIRLTVERDGVLALSLISGIPATLFYRHYAALRRRRKFLESLEDLDDRLDESPVLYLRPFNDDRQTARLIGKTTEFEQLAMIFNPVGPFITIGAPHEKLPKEVGAFPIYVNDAQWEQSVVGLMAKAQLIILRIGVSPSLLWEVETAIKGVEPERLILLVPRNKRLYEDFRESTKGMFQYPLPECDMKMIDSRLIERVLRLLQFPFSLIGFNRSISLHGLIYFEPDSTPHYAKLGIELFRGSFEASEVPKILRALRPVFNQLGIDWKLPRLRFSNSLLVCYAFFTSVSWFGWFVLILLKLITLLFGPKESVLD